ncbi:MAG: sulfatase-like hydrolase/transferase, partial [Paenibacillaceae bacterium]|nr:sulfatase-like hydrolase/transferase [Paenibacillaceae bacterium]
QPLSKCSGSSLLPFLKGEEPAAWRDSFYAQCNGTELYYISRMVKTRKYKFVYNPTDLDELYDLEHDPYELVNVAARPEMAGVLKQMYKKMWENAFASEDMNFVTYIPTVTGLYGPSIINERQEETV